jgi:hypothetical protein
LTSTAHRRAPARQQPADLGLVVEEVQTGWVGAVVRVEKSGGIHLVVLEDRNGRTRSFPLGPGFWVDGAPVVLTAPVTTRSPAPPARTASGSVAVHGQRARVARGSRIWVEGKHDAELVEKVWGDDLRVEGVVVELLDGVDNLAAALKDFGPTPERRVGVLVDHLVPGSKESRLAGQVRSPHVLVVGHPYIDIWAAVRPEAVGISAWPTIPPGRPWKDGVLAELGWDVEPHVAWRRILAGVRTWNDLQTPLLTCVESLIDFVTGCGVSR